MTPPNPLKCAMLALGAACALSIGVAPARAARAEPSATLNFPDTDVESAARAMAAILGRPIFVDPRVKGKLSLYTEQGVTPAQAYQIFVAALRGLGSAVVESRGLLKVVPEAEAKLQTGLASAEPARARGDQVVTQVIPLVHENASNLVPVLRPLIAPNNTITANAGNNTLVITDYAENLERLQTLIAALDTPSATDVEVIPVHNAIASDLAATVLRMTDGAGQAAAAPAATPATAAAGASAAATSIVADPRLNALLVRAPNPARLAAIRALVAQLDRAGGGGVAGGNIHVIYLKNAEATRLATVLRAAAANDAGRVSATGGGTSPGTAPIMAQAAAASPAGSGGNGGSSSASAQSTAPVSAAAQPSTGGYIQADPAANALIITAPEPLFRELRAVVELLDTRRAQLYVESLVVEVDAAKALDIGLQWKQIFSISQSSLSTLTLGNVASALESMSGTNILSTANVVTLDNEEAKIVVGQNVPFVTGSYTTGSSASPFQTVERKDVGITLRIRPQIGQNGSIRMTIFQESSSVSSTATPGTSNAGPATNKRSIESTVMVNDGRIVVLGGLIEDAYESDAGKIPFLGDIPLLGGLFRYLNRTRRKTNLVVFLRPHVMADEAALDATSLDRYDYIRARQRELPQDVRQVLPQEDLPLLPAAQP
jgi:general secretion pathway protein D